VLCETECVFGVPLCWTGTCRRTTRCCSTRTRGGVAAVVALYTLSISHRHTCTPIPLVTCLHCAYFLSVHAFLHSHAHHNPPWFDPPYDCCCGHGPPPSPPPHLTPHTPEFHREQGALIGFTGRGEMEGGSSYTVRKQSTQRRLANSLQIC
jgi:hypothetical protein